MPVLHTGFWRIPIGVLGGAQGIGLRIAKACLKEGMQVVIADIKAEQLTVAESTLDNPENVLAIELDVSDRDAMEAAADKTEAVFEKVHVVCNNAGISPGGPVVSVTWENWHRTMDTDLADWLGSVHRRCWMHSTGSSVNNFGLTPI